MSRYSVNTSKTEIMASNLSKDDIQCRNEMQYLGLKITLDPSKISEVNFTKAKEEGNKLMES